LWGLHLVSGAALVALLGLHMTLMHYQAVIGWLGGGHEDVLAFASVVVRDRAAAMRVVYVLLLGFALYHGLYGARGILQEIWDSPRAARLITVAAVVLGLVVFIYGVAVIVLAGRHAALL
jgi:succinate dehydrogenase / fumarate reductase membrane anchor subunit